MATGSGRLREWRCGGRHLWRRVRLEFTTPVHEVALLAGHGRVDDGLVMPVNRTHPNAMVAFSPGDVGVDYKDNGHTPTSGLFRREFPDSLTHHPWIPPYSRIPELRLLLPLSGSTPSGVRKIITGKSRYLSKNRTAMIQLDSKGWSGKNTKDRKFRPSQLDETSVMRSALFLFLAGLGSRGFIGPTWAVWTGTFIARSTPSICRTSAGARTSPRCSARWPAS